MKTKKVYLVGAGPGGSDLITVRGLNILKEAEVVIYDYLVDRRILENTKEGAELICCDKLDGDRYPDGFLVHQEKIDELMVKKVKEGKKVVRLKNGDPSIFGRCSQELETLIKNKIDFEIVPGVTAANAASCLSGIPLTDRRFASDCVFVTGHQDPSKKKSLIDWGKLSKCGTLILYMAVENLEDIVKGIIKSGRAKATPAAIIQDVSLPTQRLLTGTLKDIAKKARLWKISSPAVVIVGEVVNLESRFNWFRKNKRILFTGLSKERYFTKEKYFHLPLIKIEPMENYRKFDNYLKNIKKFDWIVFTSRYGVEYFFKRLKATGQDSRALGNIKIAAIGNSTGNRLLEFGIRADLIPEKESSRGLIEKFKKMNLKAKRIFLPRSDISDKGLSQAFRDMGARVTQGYAYKNVMPDNLPELDLKSFDEIVFSSPSTVRNFKKRYKAVPENVRISCIGETTLKEARRCRLLG